MDFCGWRGTCGWCDRVNRRGGEWLFGEESVGRIDMSYWIVRCEYRIWDSDETTGVVYVKMI